RLGPALGPRAAAVHAGVDAVLHRPGVRPSAGAEAHAHHVDAGRTRTVVVDREPGLGPAPGAAVVHLHAVAHGARHQLTAGTGVEHHDPVLARAARPAVSGPAVDGLPVAAEQALPAPRQRPGAGGIGEAGAEQLPPVPAIARAPHPLVGAGPP